MIEQGEQDLNEISLIEDNEDDVYDLPKTDDFYLNDVLGLDYALSRKRRNPDDKFKIASELSEEVNERRREAARRQSKNNHLRTFFYFICPFCNLMNSFFIMI